MASPGARKGLAGKCEELTSLRQRGGRGMALSLTHSVRRHFPRWRVGLSVSRRCGRLSHKRCDRSHTDRSNPTRAGPYPCGSPCSNFPQGKVRSQLRSAMSADGGARHGPVREESRFGPSRGATLLSLLKHRSVVRRSSRHTLRLVPRLDRVAGGFAWTQWLTTLTGESPTPSPGNRGKHVP
jgi:hypothetical protein